MHLTSLRMRNIPDSDSQQLHLGLSVMLDKVGVSPPLHIWT